jgi:lipopolysaccharide export system permease protein
VKLLDRHLASHVLGMSAIVALVLVALFTFISFVAEIDEVDDGGFGVVQLVTYTFMTMPAGLYTLLPIIAMLGTLAGLGILAGQGELTAIRAAGVSTLRIGGATLIAGAALAILCLALGDWLVPLGQRQAEQYRTTARQGTDAGVALRPIWLRDGEHLLHIRRLLAEDHIADIEIYSFSAPGRLGALRQVDEARFDGRRWQMRQVQETRFEPDRIVESRQAELEWSGQLSPEVLRLFVLQANSLSIRGLFDLVRYMDRNGLDSTEYRLSLWRKLVAPFTVMAMMLFAVPFVFGSLRSAGMGQRLLVGVMIGVAFYVVNEVCASLGQLYGWPAFLAAALPTLALGVVGTLRLRSLH